MPSCIEAPEAPALVAMRGDNAFDHWLLTCGQNPWEPLSPDAAKPYGFIWHSWLRFLAPDGGGDPHAWAHATPQQVLAFINHGPQSPKTPSPATSPAGATGACSIVCMTTPCCTAGQPAIRRKGLRRRTCPPVKTPKAPSCQRGCGGRWSDKFPSRTISSAAATAPCSCC